MSCESSLSGEYETIILTCNKHGSLGSFPMLWEQSVSAEHVYAVWLKHLGEQS